MAPWPGGGAAAPSAHSGSARLSDTPKTIREKQRGTVGGQELGDVVDKALGHRPGPIADVDRQQQLARGPSRPTPTGAYAPGTRWPGDSLTSSSCTALRRANNSSSWTWLTCRSWRKWRENACRCSAASTNHCNTVLGSTSKTRAVPRMPRPSAKQAITRTISSGTTRWPWKIVPRVSRK